MNNISGLIGVEHGVELPLEKIKRPAPEADRHGQARFAAPAKRSGHVEHSRLARCGLRGMRCNRTSCDTLQSVRWIAAC